MDTAGQSDAQRDLLLLTSFGVLGSCISSNVSVLYSGKLSKKQWFRGHKPIGLRLRKLRF